MQTIYSETRGTPHDLNWNNASKHPTSTFDLNGQARAWSRGKKKRWAVVRYSQGFGAAVLGEFDECDAAVWRIHAASQQTFLQFVDKQVHLTFTQDVS